MGVCKNIKICTQTREKDFLNMDINKFMTPRLMATAKFVKNGSKVSDIGTDHAYIPIWLVENGICDFVTAMDINEGPLLRAEDNIKKFGLENKIVTRLSDGVKALKPYDANTVIIAGMGGILINKILEDGKDLYPYIDHYILQPMTAVEETRKYLEHNGFIIEDECLAKEDDKIYNILSVIRGEMKIEENVYYYIGKKLIENHDELLMAHLDGKIYELKKAINSMEYAKNPDVINKREKFVCLMYEMEKIKENCKS